MMAIGTRWPVPLGESSRSAKARGPVSRFWTAGRAVENCAQESGVIVRRRTAQMTNLRGILYNHRYNESKRGDAAMDINDKAPEFTLPDQNGEEIALKAYRGKYVVLFFYPRADTPGCTIEACEFRDSYKQIQKTGAVLLGISPDTSKAQKKFEEKFSLPFPLLADADKKVCNAFDVIVDKNMYGKKVKGVARTTFVIGPDGKIVHVFRKVKPEGHSGEVLEYLKTVMKGVA